MTLIGKAIKRARESKGLSLRALEELTSGPFKVSNAYISQIETGKVAQPSPSVLYVLAEALALDYRYLMELCGYPGYGDLVCPANMGELKLTKEEYDLVKNYIEFVRKNK